MRPFERPLHLLLLDKPFAHNLIDSRLNECRTDGITLPVSFAEIRDEFTVVANVGVEPGDTAKQLGNSLRALTVDLEVER